MEKKYETKLSEALWIEVQKIKKKIQEVQLRDDASKWKTRLDELEKQVDTLSHTSMDHELYIDTWKNAGFTTTELEEQVDNFNRNASVQTLIDEVNSKNVAIGVGFTELTFKGDELEQMIAMCTPGFPKNNLSCGILQISGILNAVGQYEYNYKNRRIHVIISEDGNGVGNVEIKIPTIGVNFNFALDNHVVIWADKELEVRRKSIILKYIRSGDKITIYAGKLKVDLKLNKIDESYIQKQELSVVEFLALVQDLPRNMTHIMTIIPDWDGTDVTTLEIYLRKNTMNELFDVFSIYVNEASRQGPLSLASSYAQSAIASLSSTNQILASTILKQAVTYESESGIQDVAIGSSGVDQRVVQSSEAFPNASSFSHAITTDQTFIRNVSVRPDSVTGILSKVKITYDVPNQITIGDENKRMIHFNTMNTGVGSGINYQLLRKGEGFKTIVKAEIDWVPDQNNAIDLDKMETGVWIGSSPTDLRSVSLNIDGQGIMNRTSSANIVQAVIDFNEMGCKYKETDRVWVMGKKLNAVFSGSFRIRIDATTLLDIGGAEDLTLTINYKLNGVERKENVACVRRYVNAGGTKQKLVYEGVFGRASKSGIYVLGHVSNIRKTGNKDAWYTSYGESQIKNGIFVGESMLYDKRLMKSSILKGKGVEKPPERVVCGVNKLGKDVVKGTYYIAPISSQNRYLVNGYDGVILGISIFSYFDFDDSVLLFNEQKDADIDIARLDAGFGLSLPTMTDPQTGKAGNTTISLGPNESLTVPNVLTVSQISIKGALLDNTVSWLVVEPMELSITSLLSNQIHELALPNGLYSNIELNEDTIKLIENVEMLKRYSRTLQGLLDDLQLRVSHIENVVDNIIDVVSNINDKLNAFIKQASQAQKPSPWGIAGGIMSFLSTSVGMFFPIIGTAIGVAGQIVEGIGSLTEGDVAAGTMELITGGLAAGLGTYKFGKRMKAKLGSVKVINDGPRPSLGNNKIGTKVKNRLITNGDVDLPPSYDEATMGRKVRRKRPQIDFAVQTTSVERVKDATAVKYRLHSSNTQPYQSHSHKEWESLGGSGAVKHAMLDYKVTDECDINGIVLSRKLNGNPRLILNRNGVIEVKELTDVGMRETFGSKWKDGALNDIMIRRYENVTYTTSSRTNYAMDEDIVRILTIAGSSTNVTESHALMSAKTTLYHEVQNSNWLYQLDNKSGPVRTVDQSFSDSIYTLNTIFIEKHKDSVDTRGYMDEVANTLLNVNVTAMITDTIE